MKKWVIANIISIFVTFIVFLLSRKINIEYFEIFSFFVTLFISFTTICKAIAYKVGKDIRGFTIFTISSTCSGIIISVFSIVNMILAKSRPVDVTTSFSAGAMEAFIFITCVPPCFICGLIGIIICAISNRKYKNSSDKDKEEK